MDQQKFCSHAKNLKKSSTLNWKSVTEGKRDGKKEYVCQEVRPKREVVS